MAFEGAQGQLALPAELAAIHPAALELFDEPLHFRPAAPRFWGNPRCLFVHPPTQPEFQPRGKVGLVEYVHRFTRAVSVGNPREFLQAEKQEQEMAEACKRLIKNCIICWNYLYLS
jgi:hypothetical protein